MNSCYVWEVVKDWNGNAVNEHKFLEQESVKRAFVIIIF